MPVEATNHPLAGLWKPSHLQNLYYGPSCVEKHLLSILPSSTSKACIVTGNSLATKTPLIKQLETLLGDRHAATFSKIGEHAPIKQIDEAAELFQSDNSIDTIIAVGGGSPIDSAKVITNRIHEKSDRWLYYIAIPTTLSAAECTGGAGYTKEDGTKTGLGGPELAPRAIFYDSKYGLETPSWLFLSTGLRALDHAMELMYHDTASELCRLAILQAAGELFANLPKYKADPKNEDVITRLFLAAFASLGFFGSNVKPPLGLSHSLGYALGSPYKIPHGITSCLTLGRVVKFKAQKDKNAAAQLARMAPFIGSTRTGDDVKDGVEVGDRIIGLVKNLGLETNLTDKKVGKDQVGIIIARATGMKEGAEGVDKELYAALKDLVECLY